MKQRAYIFFGLSLLLFFLLFVANILFGSVQLEWKELFQSSTESSGALRIILYQRLSSASAALLCGAGLAVCGLLMQTFFRNILADPYILGISSGSGLGVALLLLLGSISGLSLFHWPALREWSVILAAGMGGLLVFLLVLFFSRFSKSSASLLIAGVLAGSFCTALIAVIQVFVSKESLQFFFFWSMSGFREISWWQILCLFLLLCSCLILAYSQIRALNVYLLGERYASGLGVNLKKLKQLLIIISSLLAGGVTAFAGPVGFVGLMTPHACRMLLQTSDHKLLIPAVAVAGAILCLLCNLLSSGWLIGVQLPLNVYTSILGVPFMIWLLFKNQKWLSGD